MEREIVKCDSLIDLLEDLDKRGISGVQRYRAVNGFISLKSRYRDIPVSGTFELTPFCNLDCKMCYVHLNKNQIKDGERLLTVMEWKEIIDQAVNAGMMYATLTGGECLTYPGFKEIYLYLVSLGIHPDVLTNGRLLTKDMIEFFSSCPPAIIQVSLYGSSEDAYESVTGYRAFHEVMNGIMLAKEAGLNLSIAITLNKYMTEGVDTLLGFVHSLGIPYSIGNTMIQSRSETGRDDQQHRIDSDNIRLIVKTENDYIVRQNSAKNKTVLPMYVPAQADTLQGLPCGGAHSTFHVNWKGELCPCIGFSESVHCPVRDIGFDNAWKQIGSIMKEYKPPKECSGCELYGYCQICPAERGTSKVEGVLNTGACEKVKLFHEENQRLMQITSKNECNDS